MRPECQQAGWFSTQSLSTQCVDIFGVREDFGEAHHVDLLIRKCAPVKSARLIDRGLENRQHGNKPYFTRVSLSFSTGNTAATGGNMLLVLVIRRLRSCIKIAILKGERQKRGQNHKIAAKSKTRKISSFEIKIRIRITIKSPRNTRLICRSEKPVTP